MIKILSVKDHTRNLIIIIGSFEIKFYTKIIGTELNRTKSRKKITKLQKFDEFLETNKSKN